MSENHNHSLQERVAQLEAIVAKLQGDIDRIGQKENKAYASKTKTPSGVVKQSSSTIASQPKVAALSAAVSRPSTAIETKNVRSTEYWLNRVGIALVLFGVAFLFKYSVDQGWLTPAIRLLFGLLLGIGCVTTGLCKMSTHKHFGHVLTGGGVAIFYITGFAAFQIFHLFSYPVAFAFLVTVTLLSFLFSLQKNSVIIALIGTIGGLGTPFLLYTGVSNLSGLVGYTCLLLSGAGVIFFYRGWLSLLWVSVIGGYVVFSLPLAKSFANDLFYSSVSTSLNDTLSEHWVLQGGILFAWLLCNIMPVWRVYVWEKNPARWRCHATHRDMSPATQEALPALDRQHLHVLAVLTPFIALWLSFLLWPQHSPMCALGALAGAIIYAVSSRHIAAFQSIADLSHTYVLVGIFLATNACYVLLDGDALFFVLATEAALLHIVGHRLLAKKFIVSAHILFAILGLCLMGHLFEKQQGLAIFNAQAMSDIWGMGMAFWVALAVLVSQTKKTYLLMLHVAVLGWLLRELAALPEAQGYVTVAWGVYSVGLLILGLRKRTQTLRTVAMYTLFVVLGRLFIVDFARLETLWRVLLFMGFGGVFLLISYYTQAMWKPDKESSETST